METIVSVVVMLVFCGAGYLVWSRRRAREERRVQREADRAARRRPDASSNLEPAPAPAPTNTDEGE